MADKYISIFDGLSENLPDINTAKAGRFLITTDKGEMYYEPEDGVRIKINKADQIYTPNSENAQSGLAMKEAINSETATNLKNGSVVGSLRTVGSQEENTSYTMGNYAFAEGYNTKSSNDYSHSEGYRAESLNLCSHAEGESTRAIGQASHAEGKITNAVGEISHAEGYNTKASGNSSHAEGHSTEASGDYSHSEGSSNTQASGEVAHAEGVNTCASGNYSHSEGVKTEAIGNVSHAEGYDVKAIGFVSHAEGRLTNASGKYTHVEGLHTIALSNYQHVQGKYNIGDTENNYVDIVGNGNENTGVLSNAYTLDWNGNGWFSGDVYVGSTSGVNRDEGSHKLATEEYVNTLIEKLKTAIIALGGTISE